MNKIELIEKVKQELTEYLDLHKQRKTQERYAILGQIYSTEGHFDIESLLLAMNQDKKFRISRATLYNTMELFVAARLVTKLQFGNTTAMYERTKGIDGHHHLICTTCGYVGDIKDKAVKQLMYTKKIPKFKVQYYSFYIYGVCSKCQYKKGKQKTMDNQVKVTK